MDETTTQDEVIGLATTEAPAPPAPEARPCPMCEGQGTIPGFVAWTDEQIDEQLRKGEWGSTMGIMQQEVGVTLQTIGSLKLQLDLASNNVPGIGHPNQIKEQLGQAQAKLERLRALWITLQSGEPLPDPSKLEIVTGGIEIPPPNGHHRKHR